MKNTGCDCDCSIANQTGPVVPASRPVLLQTRVLLGVRHLSLHRDKMVLHYCLGSVREGKMARSTQRSTLACPVKALLLAVAMSYSCCRADYLVGVGEFGAGLHNGARPVRTP